MLLNHSTVLAWHYSDIRVANIKGLRFVKTQLPAGCAQPDCQPLCVQLYALMIQVLPACHSKVGVWHCGSGATGGSHVVLPC